MNTKNNNENKYFVELIETNGQFKVDLAKKLVGVNQFKNHWQRINARDMARKLNVGKLLIK